MTAFEGIEILEVTLTRVGNQAMWDAALQILPLDGNDRDRPVVAKAIDGKGNQIWISRIDGIPTLIETSRPERLSETARRFQSRWHATPLDRQTVIRSSE